MDSEFVFWAITVILGGAFTLLSWYFKRDQDTTKHRLNTHAEKLEGCVRKPDFDAFRLSTEAHFKFIEKSQVDLSEKFARELKDGLKEIARNNQEMINEMHRRIDDHSKKHDERLDRMIVLITSNRKGD